MELEKRGRGLADDNRWAGLGDRWMRWNGTEENGMESRAEHGMVRFSEMEQTM